MGNGNEKDFHPAPKNPELNQSLEIFSSPEAFRGVLIKGLERLLADKDPATQFCSFNICCSNAYQDPRVLADIRPKLETAQANLLRQLNGNDQDSDVLLFRKINEAIQECGGWDNFSPIRTWQIGDWIIKDDLIRGFKKPHAAARPIKTIFPPHDSQNNFFDRPDIREQIIWQGKLYGRQVRVFFNKFAFYCGGLLTYGQGDYRPQLFTKEDMLWLCRVGENLASALPSVYIGGNSHGGSCSITDWHVHLMFGEEPYPVESLKWHHNGGSRVYPTTCFVSTRPQDAADWLEECRRTDTPHNFILKGGENSYGFRRRPQDPERRQAFYELGGKIMRVGSSSFTRPAEIEAFLASVRL